MSWIFSGLVSDVENIFKPGLSVISGIASTVASPFNDIKNAIGGIQSAFGSFVNTIKNIPNDIMGFFQSVAGAILGAFERFGEWVYSGFSTFAQHVVTAVDHFIEPIKNFFISIIDTVKTAFSNIWNFISGIVTSITNEYNIVKQDVSGFIKDVTTFFSTLWNDIVSISQLVSNFLSSFSQTVENFLTYFDQNATNIVDTAVNIFNYHNDSLPFNLISQEASRIALTLSREAGWLSFMETMKRLQDRTILAPGHSLLSKLGVIALSPLIAGFTGLLTEYMINSFYPDATTSQVRRMSPLSVTTSKSSHSPIPSVQYNMTSQVSPRSISQSVMSASPTLPNFKEYHHRKVISMLVKDLLMLGQTVSGYGTITVANEFQILSDTIGISTQMLWKLASTVGFLAEDELIPSAIAGVLVSHAPLSDTVTVQAYTELTQIYLPPGATVCQPPSSTSPYITSGTYSEVPVDFLNVEYSYCFPINNMLVDIIIATAQAQNILQNTNIPPTEVNTTAQALNILQNTNIPPTEVNAKSQASLTIPNITPISVNTVNVQASAGVPGIFTTSGFYTGTQPYVGPYPGNNLLVVWYGSQTPTLSYTIKLTSE